MLPPKTDPRWDRLISNLENVPVTKLVTKMLMTRLRMMNCEKNVAKRKEAIDEAYAFFTKNEALVQDDIKLIFS